MIKIFIEKSVILGRKRLFRMVHDGQFCFVLVIFFGQDTWSTRCSPWGHPRSVVSRVAFGSRRGISLFHVPSRIPCGKEVKVLPAFDFRGLTWSRKFGVQLEQQRGKCEQVNKRLLLVLMKTQGVWKLWRFGRWSQKARAIELQSQTYKAVNKQKSWGWLSEGDYLKFSHVLSLEEEQPPLKSRKLRS